MLQNGHQFVGISGLTRKCGARRTVGRSPTCVGSIRIVSATEIGRGHEKTEWLRVVIFTEGLAKDRRAVFAQRFEGILEGAWQTREWMDNLGLVLQGYSANITTLFDRHEGNGDSLVTTISALGMIDPRTNRQRFPRTVVQ